MKLLQLVLVGSALASLLIGGSEAVEEKHRRRHRLRKHHRKGSKYDALDVSSASLLMSSDNAEDAAGPLVTFRELEEDAVYLADGSFTLSALQAKTYEYNAKWQTTSGDLFVVFEAKCANDIHIALFDDKFKTPIKEGENYLPYQTTSLYEIVGGGWGNTQSVIRFGTQIPSVPDNKYTESEGAAAQECVCSSQQFRHYWFSFTKSNFEVKFGKGSIVGVDTIVSFAWKKHQYAVNRFAFSTWNTPITYRSVKVFPTKPEYNHGTPTTSPYTPAATTAKPTAYTPAATTTKPAATTAKPTTSSPYHPSSKQPSTPVKCENPTTPAKKY